MRRGEDRHLSCCFPLQAGPIKRLPLLPLLFKFLGFELGAFKHPSGEEVAALSNKVAILEEEMAAAKANLRQADDAAVAGAKSIERLARENASLQMEARRLLHLSLRAFHQ